MSGNISCFTKSVNKCCHKLLVKNESVTINMKINLSVIHRQFIIFILEILRRISHENQNVFFCSENSYGY